MTVEPEPLTSRVWTPLSDGSGAGRALRGTVVVDSEVEAESLEDGGCCCSEVDDILAVVVEKGLLSG